MHKKSKDSNIDLYYQEGQPSDESKEERNEKKKIKERKKRIQENKKTGEEKFDIDTETVIGMTNRNNENKKRINKYKMSKKQLKKQKKLKRIKKILKIVFLLVLIIGATVFTMCSPIFNIKDIKVLNNKIVSSENIVSLSGLNIGENLFKFSEKDTKNRIKENSYVEDVKIKRVIPNEVQIEIVEREPRFSISILGSYAYISTQGYILEKCQNELNLLVINGISTSEEKIEEGKRLEEKDLEKLEVVLKIMDILKENEIDSKITSIDINNENDYIIVIQEELKTIHLGDDSNLNNKILYALSIMEKEKEKEGTIYVNGDYSSKKFQPYFREKV